MKFRVGKDIYVEDPTPEIGQWVKKNLVLQNPDYYKKQAMGLYTGNTPKEIWLFQMDGGNFRLPFGTFADLWRLHPVEWDWKNEIERNWFRVFDYKSQIKPYDYQESAIQAMLDRKNGIILMQCGGGKTMVGLEAIARIGGRALWLTHTGDLLRQSRKRAESVFGIDKFTFGEITGGKVDIGESITFATVQTMCGIDLAAHQDDWDVVVVDECMLGDTLIDIPSGKKALKDLCIDDIVMSYNEQLHEWECKRITHLFKHKAHDIVKVKLSNGEEIVCTGNHPIFTQNGQWIEAERLRKNYYVLQLVWESALAGRKETSFFQWVRVESVEIQEQTSDGTFGGLCPDGYVYNIEVEDNNNYFAEGVLVHNCQHCAGSPTRVTQFYKVVSNLRCRYKFGLTATLHRSDGLERAVTALLGNVIHEVDRACVADTTVPIKVEWVETGYKPDIDKITEGDGTLDYAKMCEALIEDDDRFTVVVKKINSLSMKGGAIMVLANRVEYLKQLREHFFGKSVCLSGMGQSKKAKAERKQALDDLNNGDLDCIFATYQLAAEGLDVPNLRYVVMATPEKNERTVIQAAGRVGRKAPGKEYGTVIDFVDDFSMYKGWANKRRRYYDKLGGQK